MTPSWARGSWRGMLLFQRICELHDAAQRCWKTGFEWSDDDDRKIEDWIAQAKHWIEVEELDECEQACMQAEIVICEAKKYVRGAVTMVDESYYWQDTP